MAERGNQIMEELEMKLNSLNDELLKLENYVVNPEEQEEAKRRKKGKRKLEESLLEIKEIEESSQTPQKLIEEFNQWKGKANSFLRDHVTPFFSASLSNCHKSLVLLRKVIDLNLPLRSDSLSSKIFHPELQHVGEGDISSTIFKWILKSAEGILGNMKQDLEEEKEQQQQLIPPSSSSSNKKMFLDDYVKRPDATVGFACIRDRAVLSGIELSKLVARYMFLLSENNEEEMLEKFFVKIKKLENDNDVTEKLVLVMEATTNIISKKKQEQEQQKKKRKKKKKKKKKEEEEKKVKIDEDLAMDFCTAISVIGFILCTEIVPERLVNEARVTVEVIFGLTLFHIQGLKLSIGKNKHESWNELKKVITSLWK